MVANKADTKEEKMTYIVAEIETPSLREGLDLINKAKRSGADAVKVQFY